MATEHALEEVGKIVCTRAIPRFSLPAIAVRLLKETRIVAMQLELIVFGEALLILQHLIRFRQFLELAFSILLSTDIRMVLARQSAVGGFYSFQVGGGISHRRIA